MDAPPSGKKYVRKTYLINKSFQLKYTLTIAAGALLISGILNWVSFHGISLNVEPDLGHYSGIVPCGIAEHGVTSLHDLGIPASMPEVDMILKEEFRAVFG